MQVIGTTQNNEEIRSKCIGEFNCSIRLVNPSGTGTVGAVANLRLINVKAVLTRNGVQTTLFENNLQDLLVDSLYEKGLEYVVTQSNMQQTGLGQAVMTARLTLQGVCDVTGNDVLKTTVTVNAGAYNATYHSIGSCVVDFEAIETEGVEYGIPCIRTEVVDAGKNTYNYSGGNDVASVLFINYDQGLGGTTAVTDANTVVTAASLTSRDMDVNYTADRIRSHNARLFLTPAACYMRGQCILFRPYGSRQKMHDLSISFQLNGALVTGTNNVIVTRFFKHDATTFVRAAGEERKKAVQEHQRIGRIYGDRVMQAARDASGY